MRRILTALVASLALLCAVSATASAGVKMKYSRTYHAVKAQCGKKVAGINIRRHGLPPDGRPAQHRHLRAATKRLERKYAACRPWNYGHASWYGPGLYGNSFACGGRLNTGSRGVAHKTLPCGTRIELTYGGHRVLTQVVDRGPYVAGRMFDLTPGTKADLGFGSTGVVGYRFPR